MTMLKTVIARDVRSSDALSRRAVATFALGLALVAACSPAPAPISRDSADPSNPRAPEASPVVASAEPPKAPSPPEAHASAHGHAHSHAPATTAAAPAASASVAPKGAVYVCPMHPEVTAAAPGSCPKCNMSLVLKK